MASVAGSSTSARVRLTGETVMPRSSSSVMVMLVLVNITPASMPSTLIVSFVSSISSSVGVSVKSTCPLAAPAAIVMLWVATAA